MRLRHTVGAAVGALALVVTLPTSAQAVEGYATYSWGTEENPKFGKLDNPEGRVCINIPEVESGKSAYAWNFKNNTPSNLFLFPDDECQGDHTSVNAGGKPDSKLKFKSLYFRLTNT
jgi:hypothetical protein